MEATRGPRLRPKVRGLRGAAGFPGEGDRRDRPRHWSIAATFP
jgi:hypothetical protein